MSFQTPILIIAWKRPDKVMKLINSMKILKPQKIYIACDGANGYSRDLKKKIEETKKVIESHINWDYKILKKRYSKLNQGCKEGVSNAISWFFDEEKEGIILEDDCLPHPDFYGYCKKMLEKFRFDRRVWCITGCNFQKGLTRGNGSYYFSKYNHCWGWATWRECWADYDKEMESWPAFKKQKLIDNFFYHNYQARYWERNFDEIFNGRVDTWDYQWTFCCFKNGGLTVTPNVNLIENIGFGKDATHTKVGNSPLSLRELRLGSTNMTTIKDPYPLVFQANEEADQFVESSYFLLYKNKFLPLLKRFFGKIFGKIVFFLLQINRFF